MVRQTDPMSTHAGTVSPARTAVITGASRGIGAALARHLAQAGLDVALLARSAARLEPVAEQVRAAGRRAVTLAADVTDVDAVEAAVATADQQLGSIDLLVNNAGLVDAEVPLWEADPAEFDQLLRTNIYGPFLLARAVIPRMLERGGGRIIDLNSGSGTRDTPTMAGYNATKTALFRIGGGIHAAGFDRGLRAFELAPGVVATDMTAGMPMHAGRTDWTPPEAVAEIASAIAAGQLDALSGCYLRAGTDTLADLRARAESGAPAGRRLQVTDWQG